MITKKAKGVYEFSVKDKDFMVVLTNGHSDATADALTRMISVSLRHGADIQYVVKNLEKNEAASLMSCTKALARTLKKYIPDGTEIKGETCPQCKSKLIRAEGCVKCSNCEYSKCG